MLFFTGTLEPFSMVMRLLELSTVMRVLECSLELESSPFKLRESRAPFSTSGSVEGGCNKCT